MKTLLSLLLLILGINVAKAEPYDVYMPVLTDSYYWEYYIPNFMDTSINFYLSKWPEDELCDMKTSIVNVYNAKNKQITKISITIYSMKSSEGITRVGMGNAVLYNNTWIKPSINRPIVKLEHLKDYIGESKGKKALQYLMSRYKYFIMFDNTFYLLCDKQL